MTVKVPNVVNRNLIGLCWQLWRGVVLSVGWRITSDNVKKYSWVIELYWKPESYLGREVGMSEAIYTILICLVDHGRTRSRPTCSTLSSLKFYFWSNVVELVPIRPVRPHTTSTGVCLFHSELRRFPFVSWLVFLLVTLTLPADPGSPPPAAGHLDDRGYSRISMLPSLIGLYNFREL